MDRKQLEQEAKQRQALLESKFSPQEVAKLKKFNPELAQNALMSAQLRNSKIVVLDK